MSTWIRVVTCAALVASTSAVSGWATFAQKSTSKPPREVLPFVIGAGDVLSISLYGQDPALHSGDVVVRPDGKIWRYMIDEVQASGLTENELRAELTLAYSKFFKEPTVILNTKEFNSRKVGITGNVAQSGEHVIYDRMDIVQLITKAGGLLEYADKKNILILRRQPDNKVEKIPFNWEKLLAGKGSPDVPFLQPGDQVIVK